MTKHSDTQKSKKSLLREWLEQLQQESWQLELIISGFALFAIYQSKGWIDNITLYLNSFDFGTFDMLGSFAELLLRGGWLIFFINLLVHVILRGLWIGAIGLRYVSDEIDYDQLRYSKRFTSYLKRKVGDYDDFIERLERNCSIIFAYTFLLFLLLLSLLMFFVILVLIIRVGMHFQEDDTQPHPISMAVMILYFFLGLLVFLDFITLGLFKRTEEPTISKIFMVIYRFYSTITLSFLYRPLLYNFLDDKYTRRLFFLSIPYIFMIIAGGNLISNNSYPYWSFNAASDEGLYISKMNYEDQRKAWYSENDMKQELSKEKLPMVTISQLMVDQPYMEIFLRIRDKDQSYFEKETDLEPYRHKGTIVPMFTRAFVDKPTKALVKEKEGLIKGLIKERRALRKEGREKNKEAISSISAKIDSVSKVYDKKRQDYDSQKINNIVEAFKNRSEISIDGIKINDGLECYKYRHPNFKEYGLLCMYPTDSLSKGKHNLVVKRNFYSRKGEDVSTDYNIPFYKVN